MSKEIIVYTDGGCRGNHQENNIGAWGAYLKYGKHERKISGAAKDTTNNKMEIQAVIEALKIIKNKNCPVRIYVDSNYVLQGITTWISNWKKKDWVTANKKPVLNKELWIELDKLKSEFKDIQFIKVKGHSGNVGNDIADTLVNEAMDKLIS